MQYLKTGFAHCCWGVTTSDLFQWIRPKKYMNRYKCTHTYSRHTHTPSTYLCFFSSIYTYWNLLGHIKKTILS